MSRATLYEIVARHRAEEFDPARLTDFTLSPGRDVAAEIVVRDPAWSLYGINLDDDQAIFVRLSPDTDLPNAAFVHMMQFATAQQVLTLPLSALPALSLDLPRPEKIIFVFSIGRCGTTLASHMLAEVPTVYSLSEPDPFMTLALARFTLPEGEQLAMIAATTRFCYRPPAGRPATTLAIKFQSQALYQAKLFHQAFPEAKYLFLYRDATSWANSFSHFIQMVGFPAPMSAESLAFGWMKLSASAPLEILGQSIDLTATSFSHAGLLTAAWIYYIQHYQQLLANGLPFFALRYNELNRDREASTARLLAHCGLPAVDLAAALTAFDRDSQEGTSISRDHRMVDLTPAERALVAEIIASRPDSLAPDMILPDAGA